MVAYALCAGCMTGNHDGHAYWIHKPPEGVMGGFACGCKSAEECAGNGEKLLRSLFGDEAIDRAAGTPIPPVVIDITGGPLSPEERAIHAKYQSDDPDDDYYDPDWQDPITRPIPSGSGQVTES